MKLGLIARADNGGLGTLSWEFARHLKPHKVLLVENGIYQTFPERYNDFTTKKYEKQGDFDWLLDMDVILGLETFYDWSIIKKARAKGIKTALYTMFEMTRDPVPLHPDLYICPSKLDVEYFKEWNHIYLPVPVATDRLLWTKREKAFTFIHTASHGGMKGRKGTQVLLDAIKQVESNVEFKIYSWKPFTVDDSRVKIEVVNFKNYWNIWREGDVLVYPQGVNGICLPIIEAMSSGMGVITTDIYPFNEYMPKELLFKPESSFRTRLSPTLVEVEDYKLSPKLIAEKIDEVASMNSIEDFSIYGKKWAEENSWEKLLPKYQSALNI